MMTSGKAIMNKTSVSLNPMSWQDKLLLLSPRTWFGFVYQLQQSPFTQFRIELLLQSILGILLPLLVFSLAKIDPRLIVPLSPWTFGVVRGGIPPIQTICDTAHSWKIGRNNPVATDCLADRIESGRCVRCGRFDVFLPSSDYSGNAMLLLPGALIAHTAYTDVAAKLSDEGICVVNVSMEPCRMASKHLGASPRRMKNIMKRVDRMLPEPATSWSIGGHSMGCFAAMALAEELDVSSLITWGVANFQNTRTDLSQSSIPVLVLQGSNDKLCEMDETSLREFRLDFPPHTTYKMIRGAAHSWFASVKPGDPHFLGVATISMEQQQEEAAVITAKFLLEHARQK